MGCAMMMHRGICDKTVEWFLNKIGENVGNQLELPWLTDNNADHTDHLMDAAYELLRQSRSFKDDKLNLPEKWQIQINGWIESVGDNDNRYSNMFEHLFTKKPEIVDQ